MKIACPSCSSRYAIPDEKIEGKVAKIRCRKCGASIEADGRTTPATIGLAAEGTAADEVAAMSAPDAAMSAPDAAESAPDAAEVPAGLYSVDLGESDQRNMSLTELIDAYNDGEITAETYLWADGMADWQPLGDVVEIVDALHAAAAAEGEAPAPVAAIEAEAAAPVAEPAPEPFAAPEPVVAAAPAEPEPQPAAEAPQPEPVAAFTGGRDESSVLFSLSALTSSHSHAPPSSSGPASGGDDDSGLIDLKALTSQAGASANSATAPVTAAIPGIHAPAVVRETNGSKGKLYAIIAATVVTIVLIVGVVLNQRANAEEARLAAEAAEKERAALVAQLEAEKLAAVEKAKAEAKALAAAEAARVKAAEEAAEKARADAAAAAASTKHAGVKTKSARNTKPSTRPKNTTSTKRSTSSQSSKSSTSTKKRGKCGCPMGDLQCAIRCAAKKKK